MYGKQYNNLEDSGNFRQKGILVQCDHLLNTTKQVFLSFWIFVCKTQKEDAVFLHLQTQLINAYNKTYTSDYRPLRCEPKWGYTQDTQEVNTTVEHLHLNEETQLNYKNI